MATLIKRGEDSSHYYTKNGEPVHGNLRDARKVLALPSVTNIIGATLKNEALSRWIIEQAILSTISLPRLPEEAEDDFVKRVILDMDAEKNQKAKLGSRVHALQENLLLKQEIDVDEQKALWVFYERLRHWNERVTSVHNVEFVVVSEDEAFAGKVDAYITHREHGKCLVDFKTRTARKLKKGRKLDVRESDCLQLSAYRFALLKGQVDPEPETKCLSVLIDSETGDVEEHLWSEKSLKDALDVFRSLCRVWRWVKGYDPRCPEADL